MELIKQFFNEDDTVFVNTNNMGIIKKVGLYSKYKKRAEKEALLRRINNSIRSSLDINEIKNIFVMEVGKAFQADRCFIGDFDPEEYGFLPIKSEYLSSNSIKSAINFTFDVEMKEYFKYVHKHNTPTIIKDVKALVKELEPNNKGLKQLNEDFGVLSNYGFSIVYKNEILGAFVLHYTKKIVDLGDEDIEILIGIANQTAIAIKHAEQYQQIKRQAEREKYTREITESTAGIFDFVELQNKIVTMVARIFKSDKCFIRPFDKEQDAFAPVKDYAEFCSSKDLKKKYQFPQEVEDYVKSEYKKGNAFIIPDFSKFLAKDELFSAIAKRQIEHYGICANYCFPILIENELIGAFIVQFKEKTYLDTEDIDLLKVIVNHIAICLKQAEQHQIIKKQAEREAFLRKISDIIRATIDIQETLEVVCKEVAELFNVQRVVISDLKRHKESKYYALYHKAENLKDNYSLPVIVQERNFQYVHDIIIERGNNFVINNLLESDVPQYYKESVHSFGLKSVLGVPIRSENGIWGGIFVTEYDLYRHWTTEEITLLETIANQISIAKRQSDLYSRTKIQAERADFIRKIIEAVGESLDLNIVLNAICKEVFELFKPDRVAIESFPNPKDYSQWDVTCQYTSGPDILGVNDIDYAAEAKEYLARRTLEEGQDIIAHNLEKAGLDEIFVDTHKKMNIKSFIAIPLKKGDYKWGTIALSQVHRYRKWTDGEIELLHILADQAFIAIRQAELFTQSQHALKIKSEFIANMSHEFRTPLNAIIGFTDMIKKGKEWQLPTKVSQYLTNVSKSSRHLLNLINDLLDIAKVEADKIELFYENIDSRLLICDIVTRMQPLITVKDIEIDLKLKDICVEADSKRLIQIIVNLLSNAIKFTDCGGKIKITTKKKKDKFIFEIKDNGIGIAKEDYGKVFKHFSQICSSTERKHEGTGLGLVLTKKFIEMHNGSINFESKIGKGTKFIFELPMTFDK